MVAAALNGSEPDEGRRTAGPPQDITYTSGLYPQQPRELADVGLSKAFLFDLTLKIIHYSGTPTATQLTRRLGLAPPIVQELLSGMGDERLVEVMSQSDLYTGNYRYRLSEKGVQRVAEALDRTRYAGPVPVTAEQYSDVMRRQQENWQPPSRDRIKAFLSEMVLSTAVADSVARALFSGKAALFYGPSGNGKTTILERFAQSLNGTALIPYALYAQGQVIRVYDPSVHEPVEDIDQNSNKDDSKMDRRWVIVRRPAVVLGAEVGPESLDLAYDPQSRFYQAPPHIKAQGGVLCVDDFGRQKIDPKELLIRWLIPLERGWDSLSLTTGEKVNVPFNTQVLLATNLSVGKMADEALLRRILYKVRIPGPTSDDFAELVARISRQREVALADGVLQHVVHRLYQEQKLTACASYARDVVDMIVESASFEGCDPVLDVESFDKIFPMFTLQQDGKSRLREES